MSVKPVANVAVKPNVWCGVLRILEENNPFENNEQANLDDLAAARQQLRNYDNANTTPEFLHEIIPGDLLVEFLCTNNIEIIRRELSHYQLYEYQQSIFFQRHGQEGNAFQN